jgi:hypothetical protein
MSLTLSVHGKISQHFSQGKRMKTDPCEATAKVTRPKVPVPDVESPTMPRDFFDPEPEDQIVMLIDATTLRKAEKFIAFCEHCDKDSSEFPFDALLDKVTGADPRVTNYILQSPAKCPTCKRDVLEKTLVAPSAL